MYFARFIILTILVLLTGCSRDPDLSTLSKQPSTIVTYKSGRQVEEPKSISVHKTQQLAEWAQKHKERWTRSYVTYAPGTLVHGTNFSLNILKSKVILNLEGAQYEIETTPSDFDFLLTPAPRTP